MSINPDHSSLPTTQMLLTSGLDLTSVLDIKRNVRIRNISEKVITLSILPIPVDKENHFTRNGCIACQHKALSLKDLRYVM